MTLIVLKRTDEIFCKMSFYWDFSHDWTEFGLRDKSTEVKCHLHHIKSTYYHYDLSIRMITLIPGCERVCQVSPLSKCLFSPLFILLEASHYCRPHLRSEKLFFNSLKMEYLHKFSRIVFTGDLSIYSHLFIWSFIYITIDTKWYLFYTLGYIPALYYLICFSNSSTFGHWELYHLVALSLWHTP